MKRQLIPAVLATAILIGGIGCNNNNTPPFSRTISTAGAAITGHVAVFGQAVTLTTPGFAAAGAGAFQITFAPGALDALLAQFGPGDVSVQPESFASLTAAQQASLTGSSGLPGSSAGALALLQFTYKPTGNSSLFTQSLKTKQASGSDGGVGDLVSFNIVLTAGTTCSVAPVLYALSSAGLLQLLDSTSFTLNFGPPTTITGATTQLALNQLTEILAFDCPSATVTTPTASPTASPTATPTPQPSSSNSGVSGSSGTAGGTSGSNGSQSAGGGSNQ